MTGGPDASVVAGGAEPAAVPPRNPLEKALDRAMDALGQLATDTTIPKNIRRGAQSALEALRKSRSAVDVRVATAVSALDDLASDPNLPAHGRTAIWSIISHLESVQ